MMQMSQGMTGRAERLVGAAVAAQIGLVLCAPAFADTVTYTYDALGRIKTATVASGPNDGVATNIDYDPGGNRQIYATTGQTSSPAVVDFGFETPAVGTAYQYNPTVTGATFTGGAGVAGNGSGFAFATAPQGTQVGFLQSNSSGGGSITLNVTGLTSGQNYAVNYYHALRPGYGGNPVTVSFGGASLGTQAPASSAFAPVTTGSFTASGTTGQVTFTTVAQPTDTATAIDWVTINLAPAPPVVIADFGFETPALGAAYQYNPTVTGATFASTSGIAGNGSGFGFAAAPQGTQAAFLQSTPSGAGTITLNVSNLKAGQSYSFRYYMALRPGYVAAPITASFQGTALKTSSAASTSFGEIFTNSFTATGTSGQLIFTSVAQSDTATAIDWVRIKSP